MVRMWGLMWEEGISSKKRRQWGFFLNNQKVEGEQKREVCLKSTSRQCWMTVGEGRRPGEGWVFIMKCNFNEEISILCVSLAGHSSGLVIVCLCLMSNVCLQRWQRALSLGWATEICCRLGGSSLPSPTVSYSEQKLYLVEGNYSNTLSLI